MVTLDSEISAFKCWGRIWSLNLSGATLGSASLRVGSRTVSGNILALYSFHQRSKCQRTKYASSTELQTLAANAGLSASLYVLLLDEKPSSTAHLDRGRISKPSKTGEAL